MIYIGRSNARYSEMGAGDSSISGSSGSARLLLRSCTFPSGGHASANGTRYTGPGLGTTAPSRKTVSIEIRGNETTTESQVVSPTGGASSQPDGTLNSSSLPLASFCKCPFPWTCEAPSTETVCAGPDHFKVRHLSRAEKYHLEKPLADPYLQMMSRSIVFRGPRDRLKLWPRFFKSTEASGHELRDGYVSIWTTFIVAESLLASVAIQPFVTNMRNLSGWQLEVYGLLWMLALITDFVGVAVTGFFLGFLFANPGKLTYFWLCNMGAMIGVPGFLVLLATFVSLFATAYSSWVVYGRTVGIICVILEMLVVSLAYAAAIILDNAAAAVAALD